MSLVKVQFVVDSQGRHELRCADLTRVRSSFLLPSTVPFALWCEAAIATGRLVFHASSCEWSVLGGVESLFEDVLKIREYFEDDRASDELHRIRNRLECWIGSRVASLSDVTVAFADVELRELLADELRSADSVWISEPLSVDPRPAIELAVSRLLTRADVDTTALPQPHAELQDGPLARVLRREVEAPRDDREAI